jgi:hypothetical protein
MEKLNRYHVTFIATCPNNGVEIHYDLTIDTKLTIMVEDIMAEVRSITAGFHEDIADRLADRFLGRQTLKGHHHGVDITTVRQALPVPAGRLLFEQIPVDAEFQCYGQRFFKRGPTLAIRATKKFPGGNPEFVREFRPHEHVEPVGGMKEFVRRYGQPTPTHAGDTLPTLTLRVDDLDEAEEEDDEIAVEHMYQAMLEGNVGARIRAGRRAAKRANRRQSR